MLFSRQRGDPLSTVQPVVEEARLLEMQAAVRAIWPDLLPKSGYAVANAPDLEVYPEKFNPTQPGMTVDYFVPVIG